MAADASSIPPSPPPGIPYRPPHVPAATSTLGMWLFLAALFMLFGAVMLGYLFIRLAGPNSPPLHVIRLPPLLWLSTVMVMGVSFAIARSLKYLRLEKQESFRDWFRVSGLMAIGFIVVQTPAMLMLLRAHEQFRRQGMFLYGLVFVLILIHAMHVVGGIVAMVWVGIKAERGVYDHEHYLPVRHTAMYWHFLDLVWLTMFLTFLATG
jgi:heme/copper-type cytochrome/quinol oxidase subunit 3